MATIRETTFNAALAEVFRSKNPLWRSGDSVVAEGGGMLRGAGTPDILIAAENAMPIIVESEFAPANSVEQDACARLERTAAASGREIEQVVALRVPLNVKNTAAGKLDAEIRNSKFEFCLFTASENPQLPPVRWPSEGWLAGGVDDLSALIEHAGASEKLIAQSLQMLEGAVNGAAVTLYRRTNRTKPDVLKKIAAILHQSNNQQTTRMATAIIANALTFQEILSGQGKIKRIADLRLAKYALLPWQTADEWLRIQDEINYYPIFDLARRVLHEIPTDVAGEVLALLANAVEEIVVRGVSVSHDLHGRMFQRLITDRKFLATFYTLPESAMLLAEIAVDMLGVDFSDPNAAPKLRIADFACGTGALLSAAYHAVLARHRRAGHDDADIHKAMMEQSLFATDIMPAGVHLAASILSSVHPTVVFDDTKVYTLPYGVEKDSVHLGALDLLAWQSSFVVIPTKQLGGYGESETQTIKVNHESFDLVIMNPPFTRPTNHEITDRPVPSFAGFDTSAKEQKAMSARLKEINRGLPQRAGHGNAGLASNFIDLAHQKLKPGGVLAMVLPSTFAQGKSWEQSRNLINQHYDDIVVISLAAPGVAERSFSADTGMAEILLLAKKRGSKREQGAPDVRFASLRKRPVHSMHSKALARAICAATDEIRVGKEYLGEVLFGTLKNGGTVGVLDTEVAAIAKELQSGALQLSSTQKKVPIAITRLKEIAERQLLHRDINGINPDGSPRGPFKIESKHSPVPSYPCLWSHRADLERRFIVQPDTQGRPRKGMLDAANLMWEKHSTTLHFNLDFQLNSQSLAACATPEPTLGGVAWPNVRPLDPKHEPAIILWANCTLGLLLWWFSGTRQHVGRARLTITQLPNLPFLDTRKLSAKQHQKAARIFKRFQTKDFRAANEAYLCETRRALDRAVLVELLGLPEAILKPLNLLRLKWCSEPSVHGGKSTGPQDA